MEFALILPALVFLLIGTINLCLVVYSEASLHYATESAARYATIYTNINGSAPSSSTVQAYAVAKYNGVTAVPTFSISSQSCGNAVSATVSYSFQFGLATLPMTLTAAACRAV